MLPERVRGRNTRARQQGRCGQGPGSTGVEVTPAWGSGPEETLQGTESPPLVAGTAEHSTVKLQRWKPRSVGTGEQATKTEAKGNCTPQ